LLFDEKLPPGLKRHLADLFPGSLHVREVELADSPDLQVWDYAKAFNVAILTKDKDFADRVREEGPRRA
jgi:predicted nuclease of predicted toxin-antitoxin system